MLGSTRIRHDRLRKEGQGYLNKKKEIYKKRTGGTINVDKWEEEDKDILVTKRRYVGTELELR